MPSQRPRAPPNYSRARDQEPHRVVLLPERGRRRTQLSGWSASAAGVVDSTLSSVLSSGTLSHMPMTPSFASALRRLVLLLGMAAICIAAPQSAAAEKPRVKKAVATARNRQHVAGRSSAAARRATVSRARRARISRNRARYSEPVIPNVAQASFVSDSAELLRDSIVSIARQQIGTPYVWGAETPGRAFDCSGLVKYVMSWLNVSLPRTANEQAYTGIRIGRELDRMKPGDLLTFGTARRITHIGFYSGNGKYVHASRPGVGVVESLLNTRAARFRGAVRLVADADTTTSKSEPIP
jgi:cell wall-associated NlpC family hydrolase